MNPTKPINPILADSLSHHGVLGMKWYVRRYQKYPEGYSGEGKYVGPDGNPRQPTKKEAKKARKYAELKSKIDKALVDSVETGDKKTLKVLKKAMSPSDYQSAYDALVRNGVKNSIKTGNKESLKKYKNDISKRDYKDAQTLADFNLAVNKLDTDKMNKLVSKIKNEDVKIAADRIATLTDLQNKKISALKVESETSAKLAKTATTVANVGKIAVSAKQIYDSVSGIKSGIEKNQREAVERANKINKENEQKRINDVIKSGDPEKISKWKGKLTTDEINKANETIWKTHKDEIIEDISDGNLNALKKYAPNATAKDLTEVKTLLDTIERTQKYQEKNQNVDIVGYNFQKGDLSKIDIDYDKVLEEAKRRNWSSL